MAPIHDLTMLDLLIYRAYYQLVFVLHKNFYCVYTGTDWRVMCYTLYHRDFILLLVVVVVVVARASAPEYAHSST